jgi:hexosaminidase
MRARSVVGSFNLVPYPRSLQRTGGFYTPPANGDLYFDRIDLPVALRLQSTLTEIGVRLSLTTGATKTRTSAIACRASRALLPGASAYTISIKKVGIVLEYNEATDLTQDGLRAGIATLRQLLREFGRRLPRMEIRDYADFPRRGVLLDISRGRVPRLETLLQLVDHLADLKINEFQLYNEHTFAYSNYEPVWRDWGAITGEEILKLSARCRELGIDLVPNQNSFGHLRPWLEYRPLRHLAEVRGPWKLPWGQAVKSPFTIAPRHPGSLKFLGSLYDELLPYFSSRFFNVGCDETWDLGQGQSAELCRRIGKGKVYLRFLREIHNEVVRRGKTMMFWGDIVLQYSELIPRLPREDLIALNWGYEADHRFEREAPLFADSKIPFYVCPGTSTWMTLIGRHDNARANLERAARVGKGNGALGFLNTDWGDGGHPQPLAVSWIPYTMGAGLSWCATSFRDECVVPMLNRDVFADETGNVGRAASGLGLAHRLLRYRAFNCTPIGAALAAPPPSLGEMWCLDGLKYYARIDRPNLEATLEEIEDQRALLGKGQPQTEEGRLLKRELDLAARMATESCRYMLWQQSLATRSVSKSNRVARKSIADLIQLQKEFRAYWPLRNKATPSKCYPFLGWRIDDYRKRVLHYP